MRTATGYLTSTSILAYDRVRIGAGGYFTGVAMSSDGTIIIGNDTGEGPMILKPGATEWIYGMRAGATFPNSDVSRAGMGAAGMPSNGCYSVAISWRDSNYMACVCMGYRWTTTDGGANWTRRGSFIQTIGANEANRAAHIRLMIDPNNKTTIYDVTHDATWRARVSRDFGATWTLISDVPASQTAGGALAAYGMAVAIDKSSGTPGTDSPKVAIFSSGNGVYQSTNAGASFSLLSGSQLTLADMDYSATGVLITSGRNHTSFSDLNDVVRRWNGSSWTASTGSTGKCLVLHPSDATKAWLVNDAGEVSVSVDSCATFGPTSGKPQRISPTVPWLSWTNEDYMSAGNARWSVRYGGIFFTEGISPWYLASPPTTITKVIAPAYNTSVTWTASCLGLENMVCTAANKNSRGDVMLQFHDRTGAAFLRANLTTTYMAHHLGSTGFSHGAVPDSALNNPNYLATMAAGTCYTSTDFGFTCTAASGSNGGYAGVVAVRNQGEIFVISQDLHVVKQSLDNGTTWTSSDFGTAANAAFAANEGFPYANYYLSRRNLIKCPTTGDIWFYHQGIREPTTTYDAVTKGLWCMPNDGSNKFVRVYAERISAGEKDEFGAAFTDTQAYSNDFYNGKLTVSPFNPNHLWWAAGDAGGPAHLWFSKDRGVSWAIVGSAASSTGGIATARAAKNMAYKPYEVNFGKIIPPHTYPTLYVVCFDGGYNYYKCHDFDPNNPQNATLEQITFEGGLIYPNGHWDVPLGVVAWTDTLDFMTHYGNRGALYIRHKGGGIYGI